jgi:hypothetical protein
MPLIMILTPGLGILAAIAGGLSAAFVVFIVGWLLLVPVTAIALGLNQTGWIEAAINKEGGNDPLKTAWGQYVRRRINEETIERTIEHIETESHRERGDRSS